MNILVLNCGSSSVKYKLIDTADKHARRRRSGKNRIARLILEIQARRRKQKVIEESIPDHRKAVNDILNLLTSKGIRMYHQPKKTLMR